MLFLGAVLISGLSGCAVPPVGQDGQELLPIRNIAVLPTEISVEDERTMSDETVKDLEAGRAVLDDLLAAFFMDSSTVRVFSKDAVQGGETGSQLHLARDRARKLNCDAVLVTTLHRYQQREGGALAVERPASVAFDFRLLAVDAGQVLCSESFDETQQTLFENLFKFSRAAGRGFQWIPVEKLAQEGLQDILGRCPYLVPGPESAQ